LQVHFWTGGKIKLEQLAVPKNLEVIKEDPAGTSGADGLYFTSPTNTGRSAKNGNGDTVWVGKNADLQILKAHVYSQDNANSNFTVALETSDYKMDPRELALFVGDRAYVPNGWGSNHGRNNSMQFVITGESEAKAAAKALSVDCILRSPPGYKYLAQFTPTKAEFTNGEPVMVKFVLKNLDQGSFVFQRGARDNQYGFRAMLSAIKPVLDVGQPANFGGLWGLETVEPGKTFDDTIDLRKWFAFDQPGTYFIHGFYAMAFYPAAKNSESSMPWSLLWSDYASADFQVVIK
jgi:hypothetical protein